MSRTNSADSANTPNVKEHCTASAGTSYHTTSATDMSSHTVVSAPGKVLLAGGYLVLDPKYSGVVVATSSRFYTVVVPAVEDAARTQGPIQIRVRSPQFVDATWIYLVHIDQTAVRVEQLADE